MHSIEKLLVPHPARNYARALPAQYTGKAGGNEYCFIMQEMLYCSITGKFRQPKGWQEFTGNDFKEKVKK